LVWYATIASAASTRARVRLACRSCDTTSGAPPITARTLRSSRLSGSGTPCTPIAPWSARYTASTRPAARSFSISRPSRVSKHARLSGPPDDDHADSSGTGSMSALRACAAWMKPPSSARLKNPLTSGPVVTAVISASPSR